MTTEGAPAPASGSMIRRLWIAGGASAVGAVAVVIAALVFGTVPQASDAGGSRWGRGYVPNPVVVSQDRKELAFYDDAIKGKIVVINFIYTTCSNICPLVTARLAQLQKSLGDVLGRKVFFVSISIDPTNDTPERLKEFASAFPIDPSWLFLTGSFADMNVIRYKLGERSEVLTQHRNELLLFNDDTGDWQRASAFDDLDRLALSIRAMDPGWRKEMGRIENTALSRVALQDADRLGGPEAISRAGQALFLKTCASCHSVGGGIRVGPDLAGLANRRSERWALDYIMNPDQLRARNDPTAAELSASYKMVRMPNLGLSESDAHDVLSFIRYLNTQVEPVER